jgi:hypothetical protein
MNFSLHIFIGILIIYSSTAFGQEQENENRVDKVILNWHEAAANADFETYTSLMTNDAIFIGTDPTEYWKGKEFRDFAKPYFDKGKAWTFKTLERHIYINKNIAWFDELLETQMGICRGSGVLVYTEEQWKINHYVLSITIPNENVDDVKKMKQSFENQLIKKLKN